MEDLSIAAPEGTALYPLGGGNPAHIQEVQDAIKESAAELIADANRFARMIGDYDAPQGHEIFRACLADQLSSLFGAKISAEHIAVTNGSQASFEVLFNAVALYFCQECIRFIAFSGCIRNYVFTFILRDIHVSHEHWKYGFSN